MQICTRLGVNGDPAVQQVDPSQNKLGRGHVWTIKLMAGQNARIIEINLTKKGYVWSFSSKELTLIYEFSLANWQNPAVHTLNRWMEEVTVTEDPTTLIGTSSMGRRWTSIHFGAMASRVTIFHLNRIKQIQCLWWIMLPLIEIPSLQQNQQLSDQQLQSIQLQAPNPGGLKQGESETLQFLS